MSPGEHGFLQALDFEVTHARRIGGQHGVDHFRLRTADGRVAFAKVASARAGQAGFAAEAAGLRWLRAARAVPVPAVLAVTESVLVIDWVDEGRPSAGAADRFGAELARLHAAGAEHFGAPWPGVIAGLPLPNDEAGSWPDWYASCRVLPFARPARDRGALSAADVALVESAASRIAERERSAGAAEPDSRGLLVRQRALVGRPGLADRSGRARRAPGDRPGDAGPVRRALPRSHPGRLPGRSRRSPTAGARRVPLHQLHPLLVHVCLFGASYRESALAAARAVLRG